VRVTKEASRSLLSKMSQSGDGADDAICNRLLHHAHRIILKGPSRRKEDKGLDA
jgi:DNA replication protein DnaC